MAVFCYIFTFYSPHDDLFRSLDPLCGFLKSDEFGRTTLLALVRRPLFLSWEHLSSGGRRGRSAGHCEPSRSETECRMRRAQVRLLLSHPVQKGNLWRELEAALDETPGAPVSSICCGGACGHQERHRGSFCEAVLPIRKDFHFLTRWHSGAIAAMLASGAGS